MNGRVRVHILLTILLATVGLAWLGHAAAADAYLAPAGEPAAAEPVVDDTWGNLYIVIAVFVGLVVGYGIWTVRRAACAAKTPAGDEPAGQVTAPGDSANDPDDPFAASR